MKATLALLLLMLGQNALAQGNWMFSEDKPAAPAVVATPVPRPAPHREPARVKQTPAKSSDTVADGCSNNFAKASAYFKAVHGNDVDILRLGQFQGSFKDFTATNTLKNSGGSLILNLNIGGMIDTDVPVLWLWSMTALCFWKGLYEPNARRWRVLVGVLMGLGFVTKMAAVVVLLPLLFWLAAVSLPSIFSKRVGKAGWIDGATTMGLMLLPLGLAFAEIQSLQRRMPPPNVANLFIHRPPSALPGLVLAVPLAVWLVRRLLGRLFPGHRVWGAERPALETITAILAFAPVVGWLCSDRCSTSGGIYHAGAGNVRRVQILEGPVHQLSEGDIDSVMRGLTAQPEWTSSFASGAEIMPELVKAMTA